MKIGKSKMLVISIIYAVWTILAAFLNYINNGWSDAYSTIIFAQYVILAIFGMWAMVLAVIIVYIVSLVKNKDKLKDKAFMVPCAVNAGLSLVAIVIGYFASLAIFGAGFHF